MIEKKQLKSRPQQLQSLLGLFDASNYEFNIHSINKEYDQHVLNIGDFDERIFLNDNAHEELGTPQTSASELSERMLLKQGLKQHIEETKVLMPTTPLSNRQYLKNKDALNTTPVSSATQTVGQLQSLLLDKKPEASATLLAIFAECDQNPKEFITSLVEEMSGLFIQAYCQADSLEEADMALTTRPDEFAKKRLELGVTLYYKCLENIITREKKKLSAQHKEKSGLYNLLTQEMMHVSLFACSLEIVLFSYNSQKSFPWVIDILSPFRNLNFQPFQFYKVIELIIRDEEGLSRCVVKHLNSLEEQILGSLAWKADSAIWDTIKSQGKVPSCQDVALPNPAPDQKTLLASPMTAVKKISREAFSSPISSASERFGNAINSAAKRKLFDGQHDSGSQIVTIAFPCKLYLVLNIGSF